MFSTLNSGLLLLCVLNCCELIIMFKSFAYAKTYSPKNNTIYIISKNFFVLIHLTESIISSSKYSLFRKNLCFCKIAEELFQNFQSIGLFVSTPEILLIKTIFRSSISTNPSPFRSVGTKPCTPFILSIKTWLRSSASMNPSWLISPE